VQRRGGGATFVTLTARHHRGDDLRALWDGLQDGYDHMKKGRPWKRIAETFGIDGMVRAVEVTWGESAGWHPHIHLLMIHDHQISQAMAEQMAGRMFAVFNAGLAKAGMTAVEAHGVAAEVVDLCDAETLAKYVNKLGRELTSSHTKIARKLEHYAAHQLFEEFDATGDVKFLELWEQYERASFGRRRMTTSRDLFKRYGVAAVGSDEEIVAEDMGGEDTVAIPEWGQIAHQGGEMLVQLLHGEVADLTTWLSSRGIEWFRASPAPRHGPRARAPRPGVTQ
jgi:hypothetical protein